MRTAITTIVISPTYTLATAPAVVRILSYIDLREGTDIDAFNEETKEPPS